MHTSPVRRWLVTTLVVCGAPLLPGAGPTSGDAMRRPYHEGPGSGDAMRRPYHDAAAVQPSSLTAVQAAELLAEVPRVSGVLLSPDGSHVVYTITRRSL